MTHHAREPDLPPVRLAVGAAADLRALCAYRTQLLTERTVLANRTHAELHGLLPGYHAQVPRLTAPTFIATAQRLLAGDDRVRAELTRRRLARLAELTAEIKEVAALITEALEAVDTTLTGLYGVGPVNAATILGEVADIRRYRSRHAFAAATGTAPIPASSGRTCRHRLDRSGNRTLNRVLYTMAITQIRADTCTPPRTPTPTCCPPSAAMRPTGWDARCGTEPGSRLALMATRMAPRTTKAAPRIGERPGQKGGAEGTRTPNPHTAS